MNISESKAYIHIISKKTVHQWLLDLVSATMTFVSHSVKEKTEPKPPSQPGRTWLSLRLGTSEAYRLFESSHLLAEASSQLNQLHVGLQDASDDMTILEVIQRWSESNTDAFNRAIAAPSTVAAADRLWAEKVSELKCKMVFAIHTPPVAAWVRCTEATKTTPISYARNLEDAQSHTNAGTYQPPIWSDLDNKVIGPANV